MTANAKSVRDRVRLFLSEEDGPSATEYAIMIALIVVVSIGTIASLGQSTESNFTTIANVADSM